MTHEEYETVAALDALGGVSGTEAGALRLHLAGCLPCRRARVDFGEAASLIARALQPVTPPRFMRDQIIAAVGRG